MGYKFTQLGDMSPRQLFDLYNQAVEEGVASIALYEENSPADFEAFYEYIWRDGWLVLIQAEDGTNLSAFWLNGYSGETCFGHQWCYKAGWGRAADILKAGYEWCRENTPFTGIIGKTPLSYPLALRAATRAGAQVKCTIPRCVRFRDGRIDDATITFYDLGDSNVG